jgi:hypothetical protein
MCQISCPFPLLRLDRSITLILRLLAIFRNVISFLRWGVISTSPNPQAGGCRYWMSFKLCKMAHAISVLHSKSKHILILSLYYGSKPLDSFYFCLYTLTSRNISTAQTKTEIINIYTLVILQWITILTSSIVRHTCVGVCYTMWKHLPVSADYNSHIIRNKIFNVRRT